MTISIVLQKMMDQFFDIIDSGKDYINTMVESAKHEKLKRACKYEIIYF